MKEIVKEVQACIRRLDVALQRLLAAEAASKSVIKSVANTDAMKDKASHAVANRNKVHKKLMSTMDQFGFNLVAGNARGTEVTFVNARGNRFGFTLIGSSRVDAMGNARFTVRMRRPRPEALQWYVFALPAGKMVVIFHAELERMYEQPMPPTTSIGFSAEDIRKHTLAKAIKQMR